MTYFGRLTDIDGYEVGRQKLNLIPPHGFTPSDLGLGGNDLHFKLANDTLFDINCLSVLYTGPSGDLLFDSGVRLHDVPPVPMRRGDTLVFYGTQIIVNLAAPL